jgi:hypothetical protein
MTLASEKHTLSHMCALVAMDCGAAPNALHELLGKSPSPPSALSKTSTCLYLCAHKKSPSPPSALSKTSTCLYLCAHRVQAERAKEQAAREKARRDKYGDDYSKIVKHRPYVCSVCVLDCIFVCYRSEVRMPACLCFSCLSVSVASACRDTAVTNCNCSMSLLQLSLCLCCLCMSVSLPRRCTAIIPQSNSLRSDNRAVSVSVQRRCTILTPQGNSQDAPLIQGELKCTCYHGVGAILESLEVQRQFAGHAAMSEDGLVLGFGCPYPMLNFARPGDRDCIYPAWILYEGLQRVLTRNRGTILIMYSFGHGANRQKPTVVLSLRRDAFNWS